MVVIKNSIFKELVVKFSILCGKEATSYISFGGNETEDTIDVSVISVENHSQHMFSFNAVRPSDYEEGKEYMRFAVKTAEFKKMLDVLSGFESDVYFDNAEGRFTCGVKGKVKTPFDTLPFEDSIKETFVTPQSEKTLAQLSIPASDLAEMLAKGGSTTSDTENRGTENVTILLKEGEMVVSSTDGAMVSSISKKVKLQFTDKDTKQSYAGLGKTSFNQLLTYVSGCKAVQAKIGEKHVFVLSDKRECLIVGLASKCAPVEEILKKLETVEVSDKIVTDASNLTNAIKTVVALSNQGDTKPFGLSKHKDKLIIKMGESETAIDTTSFEGEFESNYFYSSRKMLELLKIVSKGNVTLTFRPHGEGVHNVEIFPEKGEGKAFLLPTMTKNDDTKEEKKTSKKEKDTKDEAPAESEESDE